MPKWPHLPYPDISFDAGGTPTSNQFDDIYFSPSDGITESETVFLDGIGAPDCWTDKSVFTIGETGFGTGLNFLLAWRRWRQTASPGSRLNYVSIEGYPLTAEQLASALKPFGALTHLTSVLVARYPIQHSGFHRLSFDDGRVSLTLMFGDVETMLSRLTARIDAWFLDGFAPAKNPDMWTESVYSRLSELSAPSAVFATFTAAGHVRRGLLSAGFDVQKAPGFGRKKERLVGKLTARLQANSVNWASSPPPLSHNARVAVVGSGIAGSSVAKALRCKGFETTVFDATGKPGGAMKGNPAVILSPKPPAEASLAGRINALAFLDSVRRYDQLDSEHGNLWLEPRGVDALSVSERDSDRRSRSLDALDWPEALAQMAENSALSPYPIARFPQSGCVEPVAVCRALNGNVVRAQIDGIDKGEEGWALTDAGKIVWQGDAVVVAAGAFSTRLLRLHHMPLYPNRGQISLVNAEALANLPQSSLSFDGYLSPATFVNGQQVRVLGSSFTGWRDLTNDQWTEPREDDHASCIDAIQSALNLISPTDLRPLSHWAGLRAAPPDRVPLVGGIPDERQFLETFADLRIGKQPATTPPHLSGLYMLAGLGSRGYQLGPLLGDTIADMIAGDPLPIERDLLDAMNPARFMARGLKRTTL